MPTIAEYRERFPSLTGLSDDALIRRVAEVQGVAPDAVIAHMGYKPPTASLPRKIADAGLAGAQGVVSGVKMFSDLAGADNPVSGALESANEGLGSLMSQARQSEVQNRSRLIDEANATGDTWEQVKAYLGGLAEAPVSTVAQGLGSIAPTLPAMLIGGPAAGAGAVVRGAAMMGMGAAQGVGAVKGATFQRVRDELVKTGMAAEDAQAKATEAQSYLGPNATDQMIAGVIGAMTGRIGAEGAIEAIVHGTVKQPGKLLPRVGVGVASEGSTEALQGGQEQFAGNRALTNAGIQTDPMMGVVGAGLTEGAVGGIIGGGLGVKAPRSLMQQAQADKGLADLKTATTPDALVDAALRATDIPLLPVGEATEVQLPVDDGLQDAVRDLTAPRIPVGEVIPNIPVGDVIEPAEEIPVGDAIPLPEVIEAGGDLPLPEGMAPRTPKRQEPAPAKPMTDADIVRAVVDGFRKTNTPQARAFVQDFDAGRIKPADVLQLVGRPPQSPDERIAAAAAQAPKAATLQPGDLLTADGAPYGTQSAAWARAKREGMNPPAESVIKLSDGRGWAVRPKESASEQPNLAGIAASPARPGDGRGADAGGSGGNLRPDPDGGSGVDRPADAPQPGSGSAGAVAVGGKPDAALIPAGLRVAFGGKTYPVESITDAQEKWVRFQESADGGMAAGVSQVGNGVPITDGAGRLVARVAYNGRAFGANDELLAEAPPASSPAPLKDRAKAMRERTADAFYESLIGKKGSTQLSSSGGRTLYDVQVTPAMRTKHHVNGRFPETPGFELRPKGDVTGNPGDRGYVLIDKREQAKSRAAPAAAQPAPAPAPATSAQVEPIVSGRGDDLVTLYHGTTSEGAASIEKDGRIKSGSYFGVAGDAVALSPSRKAAEEYANGGPVIAVRVPKSRLLVDPESNDSQNIDEAIRQGKSVFATGEVHLQDPKESAAPASDQQVPATAAKPKVHKTRRAAEAAKSGNTQRLKAVKGGYILRQATNKEMAAADRNGRRLASGGGIDVERDSLLTAIAKPGGIRMNEKADTIGEGNKNVGGKMLFTQAGKSIDDLGNHALAEFGYIPAGERRDPTRWLRSAISAEFMGTDSFYSDQGTEWMQERVRSGESMSDAELDEMREADRADAAESADDGSDWANSEDVLADWTVDDLDGAGYTGAAPEVQALTEQLIAEAEALGIDTEAIREDVAKATVRESADVYHAAVQDAIRAAIRQARADAQGRDAGAARQGRPDRGEPAGKAGQDEWLTLSAPTRAQVLAQQDALEQERAARDAPSDKPKSKLTGDQVDIFNPQGSVFDAPAEPNPAPTADPFASDYAALVGKTIEQTVTTDDGKTAKLRMDAARALRDFDQREKNLAALKACLGRAG